MDPCNVTKKPPTGIIWSRKSHQGGEPPTRFIGFFFQLENRFTDHPPPPGRSKTVCVLEVNVCVPIQQFVSLHSSWDSVLRLVEPAASTVLKREDTAEKKKTRKNWQKMSQFSQPTHCYKI